MTGAVVENSSVPGTDSARESADGVPEAGDRATWDPVAELVAHAAAGRLGEPPAGHRVTTGFVTRQGARHDGRRTAYRNDVVSLRVGAAVGSCSVEPGEVTEHEVFDCVGRDVAELLGHPKRALRVAALDAYLMHTYPHAEHAHDTVALPAGSSLDKSRARAEAVVDLLPSLAGKRVLVVGVVNSLLHALRSRGAQYVPCDLRRGTTEWGEPHTADASAVSGSCDALLVSGMTLGNGTFGPLAAHARSTGKPLVLFAQTGSSIASRLLVGPSDESPLGGRPAAAGITAVSAEPYPFFWLDGGPGFLHRYRKESP